MIMVELIQNFQDIYTKWELKAKPRITARNTQQQNNHNQVNRSDYLHLNDPDTERYEARNSSNRQKQRWDRRNRSRQKFPAVVLPKWHGIAQFKMSPTVLPQNKPRPFMGRCCPRCLPLSRDASASNSAAILGVRNILRVPIESREATLMPKSLQQALYVLRRNAAFTFPDVSNEVLECERVRSAVSKSISCDIESTLKSICDLEAKHRMRAKHLLQTMKSNISSLLLRISGWLLYKILGRMLNGIHVHKGQIEVLKRTSQNNVPIIYLPMHRSHLDYILVSFILYMNDLRAPLIAAGDNLLIPIFGNLMRCLGAFFIKRKLDLKEGKKDYVYRSILHSYMCESLKAGHSLEFFIEGGRSRSGKPCMPKAGLLSVVVDSLREGCIDDAYIAPVAISYEKILDGNFVSEQLGHPKVLESFIAAVQSVWRTLHSNFGNVRVDFCQPFSLKEFLQSNNYGDIIKSLPSFDNPPASPGTYSSSNSGSFCGTEVAEDELRTVIKELAEHVVYDSSCSTALMSTQLLAFLLITKHRKGATQQHLVHSLNWLRGELTNKKRDVGFTGESSEIIKHAASLLGKDLIGTEIIQMEWTSSDMENNNVKIVFYKPVIKLPHVLELQYYANAVLPVFLLDSVVVNALFALLDEEIEQLHGCDSRLLVMRQALVEKALELCDILQFEFIFVPPCSNLTTAINETIEELITKECLQVAGVIRIYEDKEQKVWVNRTVDEFGFDASDDEYDYNINRDQQLKVDLSDDSISYLQFLRCILSPYVESYWLAASALLKLVHEQKEEGEFFYEMQRTAQDRLHKGLLAYEESFAAETLKNSLKLFKQWNIIEHHQHGTIKIIYLHEDYDCEDKVNDVISRIEEFRK